MLMVLMMDDVKPIISHNIKNPMIAIPESDVDDGVESKSDPKIDNIANSFDEDANDNHLHFGSSHKLVPPDIGANLTPDPVAVNVSRISMLLNTD